MWDDYDAISDDGPGSDLFDPYETGNWQPQTTLDPTPKYLELDVPEIILPNLEWEELVSDPDHKGVRMRDLDWECPQCAGSGLAQEKIDENDEMIFEESCDLCLGEGDLLASLSLWGFSQGEIDDLLYIPPPASVEEVALLAMVNQSRKRVGQTLGKISYLYTTLTRQRNLEREWPVIFDWVKFHALRKAFDTEGFCGSDSRGEIWVVQFGLTRFRVCRRVPDKDGYKGWQFVDGEFGELEAAQYAAREHLQNPSAFPNF